jgi:hypothetical protein
MNVNSILELLVLNKKLYCYDATDFYKEAGIQ